jgi:hypothetical protein
MDTAAPDLDAASTYLPSSSPRSTLLLLLPPVHQCPVAPTWKKCVLCLAKRPSASTDCPPGVWRPGITVAILAKILPLHASSLLFSPSLFFVREENVVTTAMRSATWCGIIFQASGGSQLPSGLSTTYAVITVRASMIHMW